MLVVVYPAAGIFVAVAFVAVVVFAEPAGIAASVVSMPDQPKE